ncbi:NADH:ubiquinone reductase (Na(+)-transporting) subunit E [Rhizobium aegyptiacum]|uniref:NADH:ubiquinone reductase (Na(+)-transporting) subunit E n=1 Tax=Rhizobium aegyptiacum TaxID=1764550 RepID=UPI0007E55A82|nr:NADH:ubiquinone reductase (Na(+)-transporting) subunit E [Rhizobium aegyptiacum]
MTEALNLFVQAALVQNLALALFLGLCMFFATSKRMETALGMGAAVFLVLGISVPLNNLIYTYLLRPGGLAWLDFDADLSFLRLVSFIGIIAALVQMLEMTFERYLPALHNALGIFLPMVTVNCAILGGSLFMVERSYTFGESVVYAFGSGFGWALAIVALAGIQDRLKYADPPEGLRGMGLGFMVAGFMSLAFLSFSGLRIG